jgi:hypothetical protein
METHIALRPCFRERRVPIEWHRRLASKLPRRSWIDEASTVPSPKQIRIEHKLIASAREHLRGESALAIFRGQTVVSPIFVPLIGPLLGIAKSRTVIVTDNSLVTLQQSMWSESKVTRLFSRHDRGAVPLAIGRWGLKIGDEPTIFASLTTLDAMRTLADLAGAAPA